MAEQKWVLGRTEIEAWRNRVGKLEAQHKIFCKTGRTAWQKSLVQPLGRTHAAPPGSKKFWQEGIEFLQDEVVVPPKKWTRYAYVCGQLGGHNSHKTGQLHKHFSAPLPCHPPQLGSNRSKEGEERGTDGRILMVHIHRCL